MSEKDPIGDESDYILFHTRCPQGHVTMQRHRVASWRAGLTTGRLMFRCRVCGESWLPSQNDKATILSRIGR